jgi:hypothetical protein
MLIIGIFGAYGGRTEASEHFFRHSVLQKFLANASSKNDFTHSFDPLVCIRNEKKQIQEIETNFEEVVETGPYSVSMVNS